MSLPFHFYMDHCFALWRWNPQVVEIVDKKWIHDVVGSSELKLPEHMMQEVRQDTFVDNIEVLKQMETIITGTEEEKSWMEVTPLEIP